MAVLMRREFEGAARKAKLAYPLGGTTADLIIACDDLSGWPSGEGDGGYPFWLVIDRTKPNEEKILATSRSDNVITVYTAPPYNGRAEDGTNISSHDVDATVEHIWTATDADEANFHHMAHDHVHGVTSDLVGVDDTQTLTNKTMDGNANTFLNLKMESITNLLTTINAILGDITNLEAADVVLQTNITNLSDSTTTALTTINNQITEINTHLSTIDSSITNINTVLDTKAPLESPHFTGTVLVNGSIVGSGGGSGLPPGGDTLDVLVKNSPADGDVRWAHFSELAYVPGSGTNVIYPDGALTGGDTTGIQTIGSQQFRWLKFTTTLLTQSVIAHQTVTADLLVVAGGGSGGQKTATGGGSGTVGHAAGGGGAGGLWFGQYAFGMGAGGADGIHNCYVGKGGSNILLGGDGADGLESWLDYSFTTHSGGVFCLGGGGGATCRYGTGKHGGSGGGGGTSAEGGGGGGAGEPGYGYAGATVASYPGGGGGGGAIQAGQGTVGGAGKVLNLTGSDIEYAKGGSNSGGVTGPANTGQGGGSIGGGGGGSAGYGYDGGSGVIIVRYRIA